MSKVVAVLASDIHFSHNAPIARSAEPDWYKAMGRQVAEVSCLCAKHRAPLIIAGDIFDRWNSPPELINFALAVFRTLGMANGKGIYAIPGQHDLPNHRLAEVNRSAYDTLVLGGAIRNLFEETEIESGVVLQPFPWGSTLVNWEPDLGDTIYVAVMHRYIWNLQSGYPGAPIQNREDTLRKMMSGYDVIHGGDNHKSVLGVYGGRPLVFNPGSFYRRKQDERNHKPCVGLLTVDGGVEVHYLDVSQDKWIDETLEKKVHTVIADTVIHELQGLGPDSLDFREALAKEIRRRNIEESVRTVILKSLEN